ncbi:MAG: GntR family transcriptional regulator [Desulfobacteraceae bacterium]|nr:GntR family transcriptional regulator [Desulfobacteraceae bacterium]
MAGNLEDLAYNKIKVAIIKGYIKKGSKLKEVSLAESLNMSRATVKGAIKRLVYEGLAEHEPHKGASVVNPTLEEIKESFQVRAQLEKMAVSLTIDKLQPKDYEILRRLIAKEEEILHTKKTNEYHHINDAFHITIAEKSGNQVLVQYIRELMQKTSIYLILFDPFHQLLDVKTQSPYEHKRIVDQLENMDREQAEIEMEDHLLSTMNHIDVKKLVPDDYLTV